MKIFKWLKEKLTKLFGWLNDGGRWHDLGHIMGGFISCVVLIRLIYCPLLSLAICMICVLLKEFLVDGWKGWDTIKDSIEWALGIGLGYYFMITM